MIAELDIKIPVFDAKCNIRMSFLNVKCKVNIIDELSQTIIDALKNIKIFLGDELSIEYDNEVLDIEFLIENEQLLINNNINEINFNINTNKELEVFY